LVVLRVVLHEVKSTSLEFRDAFRAMVGFNEGITLLGSIRTNPSETAAAIDSSQSFYLMPR
jgi:hypothetical protein